MPPKITPKAAPTAVATAKKEKHAVDAHATLNHWRTAMSCAAFLKKVEDDEDGLVANMPEDIVAEHVAAVKDSMEREAARNG